MRVSLVVSLNGRETKINDQLQTQTHTHHTHHTHTHTHTHREKNGGIGVKGGIRGKWGIIGKISKTRILKVSIAVSLDGRVTTIHDQRRRALILTKF